MKRNKHSLSHYKLLTCDMGELVPVGCYEVLPGDSVQQATSTLIRLSPLVAPVMHPVQVRIHHWFVPNRLLWDGWEDFITGGPDGQGGSAGTYPVLSTGGTGVAEGSLADYLGVPPGVPNIEVNAMPFRAYSKIYNEFYRDQDLVQPISPDNTALQRIAWEKDYFSAARPWPQKGPDVSLPLGITAPVSVTDVYHVGPGTSLGPLFVQGNPPTGGGWIAGQLGAQPGPVSPTTPVGIGGFADLTNATAVNVNDVRKAFALQRYQEARAMYGSRYTEYLRYLGITSSDARLQRPEYLGGGKQTIAFSEVLRTGNESADATAPIGEMKGHGIAALRSRRWRRFFEEHGYVLTLMSVRPRAMYAQALHRMWSRRTKEDYWQRELEQIGQQEVKNHEVFLDFANFHGVFGYGDRYSEYRHHPSTVAADFRSTLDYWHLARQFASLPVLNQSFIECDPSKRIFAEQTQDSLWVMANNSIQARRLVKRPGVGRIL